MNIDKIINLEALCARKLNIPKASCMFHIKNKRLAHTLVNKEIIINKIQRNCISIIMIKNKYYLVCGKPKFIK